MKASKGQQRLERSQTSAISKDGYLFHPGHGAWRLNKDIKISLTILDRLDAKTKVGFRLTLQRYAEESSARHVKNMLARFNRYIRDTGAVSVTTSALINWRAMLGVEKQWHLGGLKGFLIAWHEYGYEGVSDSVVDLLDGWRIKGNETGAAVAGGCPETGPLTDIELAAVLNWANQAVVEESIQFADYAYLLALAMTARRPVQIAALRGGDLVEDIQAEVTQYYLSIPRAKQRGGKFRGTFRSLAVIEELYLVLRQQWRHSVAIVEKAVGGALEPALGLEVPIFMNEHALRGVATRADARAIVAGMTPDKLHARLADLSSRLRRCARASTARSERTGEFIRLSANRFRYTRGTKLRREGFGAFVIAELLDHSNIQNVGVYTQNTAQEAVIIDELIGKQLAPFAQACLGRLVRSEREAIRGGDPHSRVANSRMEAVGSCGSFGFCASGYSACYTCHHFQPWVDGPHEQVLTDLYDEKRRMREAGCADVVVNAKDHLILAVEHCVALCNSARTLSGQKVATESKLL